tara:strand:+ start:661 stop:2421 length:1761 start_codon:yes stop_codon:yes gene_type:complete
MLSIVIPVKNELYLEKTINNIKKQQFYENEIVLVFDEDNPNYYFIDYPINKLKIIENPIQQGTSKSRDIGIISASNNLIVTCDAHIIFPEKDFDLKFIKEHSKYPNDILCTRLHYTNALFRPKKEKLIQAGATMVQQTSEYENDSSIFIFQKIIENPNDTYPKEVPMVMGACYIFSKKRYINVLNKPLSIGSGWGMDEQKLSISNWLANGTSRVIEYITYHVSDSKEGRKKEGSICNKSDLIKYDHYYNNLSLLKMFPISNILYSKLLSVLKSNKKDLKIFKEVEKQIPKINYKLNTNLQLDDYIKYHNIQNNCEKPSYFRVYKIYKPGVNTEYKDNLFTDKQYAITTLKRSGSNIFLNWIYSQLDGDVYYLNAINLPRYKVDYKNLIRKGKWENNFNYNPINTTNKKIILYKWEHVNLEYPDVSPYLKFIYSDFNQSILLLRSPENYICSAAKLDIKFRDDLNDMDKQLEVNLTTWIDYAKKCIQYKDNYKHIVYYDRFISNKNYRNILFDKLKLSNRNEDCLDKCLNYGGGSSFDLLTYADGNAKQMDVLNRWKSFKDNKYIIKCFKDPEILELKKEIESLSSY